MILFRFRRSFEHVSPISPDFEAGVRRTAGFGAIPRTFVSIRGWGLKERTDEVRFYSFWVSSFPRICTFPLPQFVSFNVLETVLSVPPVLR